jgi:hypothetical protein
MMMNRRAFSAALVTGAAASLISVRGMAANSTPALQRRRATSCLCTGCSPTAHAGPK